MIDLVGKTVKTFQGGFLKVLEYDPANDEYMVDVYRRDWTLEVPKRVCDGEFVREGRVLKH